MALTSIIAPETPVLIVEDNRAFADLLVRILKAEFGFSRCTVAGGPQEGIAAYGGERQRFALLFVDYRFPGEQSGLDFLEALRKQDLLGEGMPLMMTSEPSSEIVKGALARGAHGVVVKPFDRHELRKQIEKMERDLHSRRTESF